MMSPQTPPTQAGSAGNQGPRIIAANMVVAILASVAVSLRFVARRIQKIGYRLDDVSILMALVSLQCLETVDVANNKSA